MLIFLPDLLDVMPKLILKTQRQLIMLGSVILVKGIILYSSFYSVTK